VSDPPPAELRAARAALGLTQAQMARMLDVTPRVYQAWEAPSGTTARPPAVRVGRLVRAYLDGHRPQDWPQRE